MFRAARRGRRYFRSSLALESLKLWLQRENKKYWFELREPNN